MTSFFRKLKWLIQGRREAELHEELQFHLDEEAEEQAAHGLPHEDAQWAARRDLGNVTLVEESTRRGLDMDLFRAAGAGSSLRSASDVPQPCLHASCAVPFVGTRHRRQHRDL